MTSQDVHLHIGIQRDNIQPIRHILAFKLPDMPYGPLDDVTSLVHPSKCDVIALNHHVVLAG